MTGKEASVLQARIRALDGIEIHPGRFDVEILHAILDEIMFIHQQLPDLQPLRMIPRIIGRDQIS